MVIRYMYFQVLKTIINFQRSDNVQRSVPEGEKCEFVNFSHNLHSSARRILRAQTPTRHSKLEMKLTKVFVYTATMVGSCGIFDTPRLL